MYIDRNEITLSTLIASGCKIKAENYISNTNSKFKEGQVWEYKTRKNEGTSILTILKIEEYTNHQAVIHIAVNNLRIKNTDSEKGFTTYIEHLPIELTALECSVTNMIGNNSDVPDFKEGYEEWKQFFDKGDAGVFSITVSEAVEYTEKTMNQK